MIKRTMRLLGLSLVVTVAAAAFYMKGRYDERTGKGVGPGLKEAQAQQLAHAATPAIWVTCPLFGSTACKTAAPSPSTWGPGGGGMDPSWGTEAAMDGKLKFYNWMLETSKGGLDTRSLAIKVHEFDWSKVNNIIYNEDGVVIRTIPAIHLEGSVSFILEWKGMKLAFSGDTLANKWWMEHAKGADLAIHECFLPNEYFVTKYKFQPAEAIYVSTLVHTTAPVFGKIMAMTKGGQEARGSPERARCAREDQRKVPGASLSDRTVLRIPPEHP